MKRATRLTGEQGAATLVAVMLMFLVMALMAAYANRSLVFEQRIASNQVRGSAALETADAGVDWAMAQLNGGNINGACLASLNPESFRQRYLHQDVDTRAITLPSSETASSCVRTSGGAWACQCLQPGAWAEAPLPASADPQPSFGIKFEAVSRPGVLRIVSVGCTGSKLSACTQKNIGAVADQMLGSAVVRTEAALLSALKTPPVAPLVSRQALPGAITADAMFRMFFGMPADKYRNQPAMRHISCDGDCSSTIAQAYSAGARMVWISGPLNLASNLELGHLDSPILIVADGPIKLEGPMTIHGLLYARGDLSWSNDSSMPAVLNGAAISEGAAQISRTVALSYQAAVMDQLSNATGSFVRVPGSWSDVAAGK